MYEKSYDVFCKEVIETEIIGDKKIKDVLETFVTIAKVIENVDASKYRAFKLKQRLMKSYPQLVFCVPKMRNVSEIVYVQSLDSFELFEEHMSNKSENNNEETIDDYDLNSDTETEKNSEVMLQCELYQNSSKMLDYRYGVSFCFPQQCLTFVLSCFIPCTMAS